MKRPSFQFYPSDWLLDQKLRKCSPAARGVWVDVLCALHNSDDAYGLMRCTLKEISNTTGAAMSHLRELADKGVLRGSDTGTAEPLVYVPRSGRKNGEPVTLVEPQTGPVWYSKRLVKDEYVRTIRGESTRFGEGEGEGQGDDKGEAPKAAPKKTPKVAPKPTLSDGTSSSSSSSSSASAEDSVANATAAPPAAAPPSAPAQALSAKDRLWALGIALLGEKGRSFLGKAVATYGEEAVLDGLSEAAREEPGDPKAWLTKAWEARRTVRPKRNGHHHADETTEDLLSRDPRPAWVVSAGFVDIFAAESAGCGPGNAAKFRNGQRLDA